MEWRGAALVADIILELMIAAAGAAALPCAVVPAGEAQIAEVLSADLMQLADGRLLRLSHVSAPRPLYGDGKLTSGGAEVEAKRIAARHALGQTVRLFFDGPEADRHGRLVAQAWIGSSESGFWLQERLLDEGAVLLDTTPGHRLCARGLEAAESAARKAERGLWAGPAFQPLTAEEARHATGRFAIIEGRILRIKKVRGETFLDFGADWREDFSLALSASDARRMAKEGFDVAALLEARVRVRGFVEWRAGPMIRLSHAEQIERISE